MKRSVKSLRRDIEPNKFGLAPVPRITIRRSVIGSACHWHCHKEHEVIFLVDGAATYVFRNREDVRIKGGQFLVIPAGLEHRISDGLDTPSFRLGFNLSAAPMTKTAPFARAEWREILAALLAARLSPQPISSATKAHLIGLARRVASMTPGGTMTPVELAQFRLLCSLVIAEAADARAMRHGPYESKGAASGNGNDIDAAIDYIERHAEGPLDLAALVRHVGYSRSRLFALFRQKTGLSPAAYHQRRRLARAQRLLDTTRLTSEQVAEKLGFDSPSYFTYAFRRCFGVTPIEFRMRDEG